MTTARQDFGERLRDGDEGGRILEQAAPAVEPLFQQAEQTARRLKALGNDAPMVRDAAVDAVKRILSNEET